MQNVTNAERDVFGNGTRHKTWLILRSVTDEDGAIRGRRR